MKLVSALPIIVICLIIAACGEPNQMQSADDSSGLAQNTAIPSPEATAVPTVAPTATTAPTALPTSTPEPALPPDWQEIRVPGSGVSFGLPADWQITESTAGRVTAGKPSPDASGLDIEAFEKVLEEHGHWSLEVYITEGIPNTELSLLRAMEDRVVRAEIIGWLGWVWEGNLIPVTFKENGAFEVPQAYWASYETESDNISVICSSAMATPNGVVIATISPANSKHEMCKEMLQSITRTIRF